MGRRDAARARARHLAAGAAAAAPRRDHGPPVVRGAAGLGGGGRSRAALRDARARAGRSVRRRSGVCGGVRRRRARSSSISARWINFSGSTKRRSWRASRPHDGNDSSRPPALPRLLDGPLPAVDRSLDGRRLGGDRASGQFSTRYGSIEDMLIASRWSCPTGASSERKQAARAAGLSSPGFSAPRNIASSPSSRCASSAAGVAPSPLFRFADFDAARGDPRRRAPGGSAGTAPLRRQRDRAPLPEVGERTAPFSSSSGRPRRPDRRRGRRMRAAAASGAQLVGEERRALAPRAHNVPSLRASSSAAWSSTRSRWRPRDRIHDLYRE